MLGWTFETVTELNQVDLLEKASRMPFGLDTESDGPQRLKPQLKPPTKTLPARLQYDKFLLMERSVTVGFSIAFPDKTAYYVPLNHHKGNAPYAPYVEILRKLVNMKQRCYIHNLSHELKAFERLGIERPADRNGYLRCTMLGAFHGNITADFGKTGLKPLILKHFGHKMSEFQTVVGGTGGSFGMMDPASPEAREYACEDAVAALVLGEKTDKAIKSFGLSKWYDTVELPFVWVLNEFTKTGLPFDRDIAMRLYGESKKVVRRTMQEFMDLTGASPSSPAQMQKLFDDGLWPTLGSRGKAGWSTNAESLQAIDERLEHGSVGAEAMELLMDYRDVVKVYSTYTRSIVRLAEQYQDGNPHPDYKHTGTKTGRLSSAYPNATNQPARGELAAPLMEMWRAEEGTIMLSADYSQIEYRMFAHFAGKGAMYDAFHAGADPHQASADLVGIERDQAKTFNFLTLYGGGPYTASRKLKIGLDHAKDMQKRFLEAQPEVSQLMSRVMDAAYRKGYVKTLAGRRNYFPHMLRRDKDVVALGKGAVRRGLLTEKQLEYAKSDERVAGNAPFQGGASDVAKKACVDLYFAKPKDLRMQTLIHDDVRSIIDNYDGSEQSRKRALELKQLKKDVMESAWRLNVPLAADPVLGFNWHQLKGKEDILER